MPKSVARPLALVVTALAALVPTVGQRHVACAMTRGPMACGPVALLGSLACDILLAAALCLLGLTVRHAFSSARCPWARTVEALRPLLALPPVAPPAALAALLRALHLQGWTTLIACAAPVALCHGLLRPRLLLSTGCAGWLRYPCDEMLHSSHGYLNQPAQVRTEGAGRRHTALAERLRRGQPVRTLRQATRYLNAPGGQRGERRVAEPRSCYAPERD